MVPTAATLIAVAGATPQVDRPPDRHHHALAWDPVLERVVLFGGSRTGPDGPVILDDLWAWDGDRWSLVSAHTGLPLAGHTLISHPEGVTVVGGPRGLTARWTAAGWRTLHEDKAFDRGGAASATDSHRQRLVVFAGSPAPGRVVGDTWELGGTDWTRVADGGPPPVMGAAAAFDEARRYVVLFGGRDSNRQMQSATWVWDGVSWRALDVPGPPARAFHGMVWDSRHERVVLFGGTGRNRDALGDTWHWDGATWTLAASAGPEARTDAMMAFDRRRGRTVLFGGASYDPNRPTFGDTWEWDGASWQLRDAGRR